MEKEINVNEVKKGGKFQWENILGLVSLTIVSVITGNYLYNNVPKLMAKAKEKFTPDIPLTQTPTNETPV